MKEFKIVRSLAILLSLLCAILASVILSVLGALLFQHHGGRMLWVYIPVCLALSGLGVIGIADIVKTKLQIGNERLVYITALRRRELYFDEIKGYRNTGKYILVIPSAAGKKQIRISQYLEGKQDILLWLSHHFPDLDIISANDEKQALLENETFGTSVEEREQSLKRAKKVARIVNGTGIVSAIWVFVMGRPYDISIFVLMLFPLLAIAVLIRFRGLIRIHQRERSIYPNLIWSFIYPCMALCLRAMIDFNIFRYNDIWIPCAGISGILLIALLFISREYNFKRGKDYLSIAGLSFFLFAYSYGLIVCLNCEYDRSRPEAYAATVLDKYISKGKSTTYYLKLSPWGPRAEEDQVDVSSRFYDQVSVNDKILIRYQKGRLRIPWFIVGNE